MSEMRIEKLSCPECGAEGKINLWNSVNVDLNPELRDKIFDNEFFLWECPFCGHKTYIPQSFIYHDMSHKFMLFFEFFDEDVTDEEKYANIPFPKGMPGMEDYTMRSVYGLLNLKEKIAILENGLNDIAVERQKYMISHITTPEIAEKGYKLLFGEVNKDEKDVSEYGTIYYFYEDEEKEQTMFARFALDNYYEHCKAIEIDPRMKVTGCTCIDQGWMEKHLMTSKI